MNRCRSLVHVYNITLVIGMEMWAGDIILQTHTNFGTIDWVMTVSIEENKKALIHAGGDKGMEVGAWAQQ